MDEKFGTFGATELREDDVRAAEALVPANAEKEETAADADNGVVAMDEKFGIFGATELTEKLDEYAAFRAKLRIGLRTELDGCFKTQLDLHSNELTVEKLNAKPTDEVAKKLRESTISKYKALFRKASTTIAEYPTAVVMMARLQKAETLLTQGAAADKLLNELDVLTPELLDTYDDSKLEAIADISEQVTAAKPEEAMDISKQMEVLMAHGEKMLVSDRRDAFMATINSVETLKDNNNFSLNKDVDECAAAYIAGRNVELEMKKYEKLGGTLEERASADHERLVMRGLQGCLAALNKSLLAEKVKRLDAHPARACLPLVGLQKIATGANALDAAVCAALCPPSKKSLMDAIKEAEKKIEEVNNVPGKRWHHKVRNNASIKTYTDTSLSSVEAFDGVGLKKITSRLEGSDGLLLTATKLHQEFKKEGELNGLDARVTKILQESKLLEFEGKLMAKVEPIKNDPVKLREKCKSIYLLLFCIFSFLPWLALAPSPTPGLATGCNQVAPAATCVDLPPLPPPQCHTRTCPRAHVLYISCPGLSAGRSLKATAQEKKFWDSLHKTLQGFLDRAISGG
jgi:hypothetical protein